MRVRAGGATTATLSGFDGVDDDQGEEEDGEDVNKGKIANNLATFKILHFALIFKT